MYQNTLSNSSDMKTFVKDLSTKLVHASGDLKAGAYLAQRVSLTIERGKAVSILGNMPQGGILWRYKFLFIIAY